MSSGSGGGVGGGGNGKGGAAAASVVPTQSLNWRSTGIDAFIAEAMTEVCSDNNTPRDTPGKEHHFRHLVGVQI